MSKEVIVLTKEEQEFIKQRNELVNYKRSIHPNFDAPYNDHLHPCYKCNCPCDCKRKVHEELGASRACSDVGSW